MLALAEVAALWPQRPVGVVVSLGCGRAAEGGAEEDAPRKRRRRRRRGAAEPAPRKKKKRRKATGMEGLFRRLGLTWDHEPRIQRRAKRALAGRGLYLRVEPPLPFYVGLAETDEKKLDQMKASVQSWLEGPGRAQVDDVARALAPRRSGAFAVFENLAAARRGAAAGLDGFLGDAPARLRDRVVASVFVAIDDDSSAAWGALAPPRALVDGDIAISLGRVRRFLDIRPSDISDSAFGIGPG